MKKLSIIIPCYNEEETIRPFLEVTKVVENQMAEEVVFDYMIKGCDFRSVERGFQRV